MWNCSALARIYIYFTVRNRLSSTQRSVFSHQSSWAKLFDDIEPDVSSKDPDKRNITSTKHGPRPPRETTQDPEFIPDTLLLGPHRPFGTQRRQTLTERESKVLTGMLDMIFNSKDAEKEKQPLKSVTDNDNGIGRGKVDDLIGRLRSLTRSPEKLRTHSQLAEMLDQKKEQMSYCVDDQRLLEWASCEVFDESKSYTEEAQRAIKAASESDSKKPLPTLQSPIYPYMVAHLMQTFRDQYRDPNLALFIFEYARNLSVASYVFGCSTDAYNELIETHWKSFKNLPGVLKSIDEMVLNGVPINGKTRRLVDIIRGDLNENHPLDNEGEETRELWSMLTKIEELVAPREAPWASKANVKRSFDGWKTEPANPATDGWAFNNWDMPKEPKRRFRSQRR